MNKPSRRGEHFRTRAPGHPGRWRMILPPELATPAGKILRLRAQNDRPLGVGMIPAVYLRTRDSVSVVRLVLECVKLQAVAVRIVEVDTVGIAGAPVDLDSFGLQRCLDRCPISV